MKRRDFFALLGGAAAAWPGVVCAQQAERMRRIGVLAALSADDAQGQARLVAFVQGLQQLGWTDGRNVRIDFRWGAGDADRFRQYAVELIALAPDVILASGSPAVGPLLHVARTVPVVFATVGDPVGAGYVTNLARPGGNATGFMLFEYGIGTKWLELLKEIAPDVRRVGVLRDAAVPSGIGQFGAIQALAPSLGVDVVPVNVGDASDIKRIVAALAGGPKSDFVDQYRHAAGYVDRILRGEKPGDLPVQAPTRYEMVINLKTAKALGLEMPASLLARADEVIE
jgi:putative ABC transport system substrate-binding protein